MVRSVIAVLAGYAFFGIAAFALFAVSGTNPYVLPPTPGFVVFATAYGMVVAVLAGYITALLAGRAELGHGRALALVIALGAALSMFARRDEGGIGWSQIAALVLMAPSAAIGGAFRFRQVRGEADA